MTKFFFGIKKEEKKLILPTYPDGTTNTETMFVTIVNTEMQI